MLGRRTNATVDPTGQACLPLAVFLRPPSFEFFCISRAVENERVEISNAAKFPSPAPLGYVGPVGGIAA
jgi:hypothetical protein